MFVHYSDCTLVNNTTMTFNTRVSSGNSRGDWWVVIYMACKSLAKLWGLFLGTSHFDLEGGQKYPPLEFVGGGHSPLELQIYLKKSHLCQFLMDSKDLYIC